MGRSEVLLDYVVPSIVAGVAVAAYLFIASRAPLSAEAIARRALEQSKNPPATASAPDEVLVGETELAPEKILPEIEDVSVFGYQVACIDADVESTVHGALKFLANEIGKEKIPTKYIELDKNKTVTPDSIKWAWLSYWEKTKEGEKICITR